MRDRKRLAPRIPFSRLIEQGLLQPGERLFFKADRGKPALIRADGKLILDDFVGSIHQTGRHLSGGAPCNGWEYWFYEQEGELQKIDLLREALRRPRS